MTTTTTSAPAAPTATGIIRAELEDILHDAHTEGSVLREIASDLLARLDGKTDEEAVRYIRRGTRPVHMPNHYELNYAGVCRGIDYKLQRWNY